jgi:hypothetical protein
MVEEHKIGRPLKFKTVEELEQKIQAYFDSCFEDSWEDVEKRDEDGEIMYTLDGKKEYDHIKIRKNIRPLTITGLALALDTSRETLLDYEDKEDYSDTIKKAKDIIHNFVEEKLFSGNVAGPIFNLINNWKRWSNKQELSGPEGKPLIPLAEEKKKALDNLGITDGNQPSKTE